MTPVPMATIAVGLAPIIPMATVVVVQQEIVEPTVPLADAQNGDSR